MATTSKTELYVVDGSNIATEGRTTPSLEQLNEAVLAFMEAHPNATVTVVVDATFGHRIAKKEVSAFDEAVANNELVTPPAGAVGRGDAFVLAIADRAKAGILSNDSFQEFHGEYEWLFDDGRLIGGKPVPHVGWVFVKRSPVRGPKSRQAVREAGQDAKAAKEEANRRIRRKGATPDAAAAPVEQEQVGGVATEPAEKESSRRGRRGRGRKRSADEIGPEQQATIDAAKAATAPKEHVNDLMPFLEFVEQHPVGTSCTAVIESYSSHGAYARVDDVLVYLPLRLMDDPAPRSARSVLALGEAVTTVIVGYVPDRRSIDVALPHMIGDVAATAGADATPAARASVGPEEQVPTPPPAAEQEPAKKAPARKAPAKKAAAKQAAAKSAPAKRAASEEPPAKKAPAKKAAAKKAAAKKAPAKKAATEKAPAKKAATEKAPAKKAATEKAPTKKAATKKAAAKKAPAKKAATKKAATKKAPAKKAATKKAASTSAPGARSGTG